MNVSNLIVVVCCSSMAVTSPVLAKKPAASFDELTTSFKRFFVSPRRLVPQQTGPVFTVEEYRIVMTAAMLDGPARAHIDATAVRGSNAFCGTIPLTVANVDYKYGWKTVGGALANADRRDCSRPGGNAGKPYPLRFAYARENGAWQLTSVTRTDNGKADWALSSALQLPAGEGVFPATDQGAAAYNAPWTVIKSR